MTLRKTIFIATKNSDELVEVKIYTADHIDLAARGLWNVDNNSIMLSPEMYNHFLSLDNQEQQRKFFIDLKQISFTTIDQ